MVGNKFHVLGYRTTINQSRGDSNFVSLFSMAVSEVTNEVADYVGARHMVLIMGGAVAWAVIEVPLVSMCGGQWVISV